MNINIRDTTLIPEVFPFIVIRREEFGGFLFNRYFSFAELDPIQIRILELCDGQRNKLEITENISKEFSLNPEKAKEEIRSAFDIFDNYFAINWRKAAKTQNNYSAKKVYNYPSPGYPALSAPLYILWDITYACNLYCLHCLADAGNATMESPLKLPTIKQILNQIVDMGIFYINFVGGEPFVRRDMLDILEYASNLPLGIIVTTNGLLINEKLTNRLLDLNIFDIQLSLDGLQETHDKFRGLPKAFEKTTKAIQMLASSGFRVTINSVMTQLNYQEIDDMVQLAIDLGATSYKAVAFLPVGRGKENIEKLLLTPDQLYNNTRLLKNLKVQHEGTINIEFEENYPLNEYCDLGGNLQLQHKTIGCAAGISQLVINPYGKVYSCPFLHDLPVGDLNNQTLREIWNNSYILGVFRNIDRQKLEGRCNDCKFLGYNCRGGCRAAAYSTNGNFWAEDPLCWIKG